MHTFLSPDRTQQYTRSLEIRTAKEAYLKGAISLARLKKVYGFESVRMLLALWVNNLAEYSGSTVHQSSEAFYEVAELMYEKSYFLGMSEVSLFFIRCKRGEYGTFFGRFDPMKFLSWVDEYLEDRRCAIAKIRQDEERARRDAAYNGTTSARNHHRARGVSELINHMLPPPNKKNDGKLK